MVWSKKGLLFFLFSLLLVCSFAAAKEVVIINSKDWKDVYSGMMYGGFAGKAPRFLESEPHSTIILNAIPKEDSITILSSRKRPFVFGYESTIKNRGYQDVEERQFDSLSLELAKDLEDINNFIITDYSYGYNSIAVAPYAAISKSYVLFADKTNIVEIENFLDERQPEELLIYGHVDREVTGALEKFEPEIINIDGDRFANNVEIVKKYVEKKPVGQVLMSNGEFIEASLMSGEYPTLFIGRNNVPDKVKEYVTNSDINTGVLIGNDLVGTATIVRRELGIATFVKFARSARAPQGSIAQVEHLDIFEVPKISLSLNVSAVRYNKITRQVEITYRNNADVVTYFKGSYTLIEGDNEQSFGDLEPVFIAANSFKTVVYDVEPLLADEAELDYYTIYGESKNSLEFVLDGVIGVSTIEIQDDTKIQYDNVYYDKLKERFVVIIENIGKKKVYVDTEIIDIIIQGERITLSSEGVISIEPGKKGKAYLPVEMDEEDIEDNPTITVRSYYGERENALVKIIEGRFDLVIKEATLLTYLLTALIIILVILVLITLTKKKCPNCGHKNLRNRKKCKKCGVSLK
ncbi:hypothetical protein GF323_04705 [Candidatus Woesearchaeota archaeon]|nr:hypothetical protein [Candidatus Woesearchaeota archaeon]